MPRLSTVHSIAQDGLLKLLDILHFTTGALRLTYRSQHFDVQRGDFPIPGPEAMESCDRLLDTVGTIVVATSSGTCRTRLVESSRFGPAFPGTPVRTLLVADLMVGGAYRVAAVLGTPDERRSVEERWLHALLHHIVVGSATLLLKEEEQLRQKQRRVFLHRVLAAQEEERRRVARELHDTVSQDHRARRRHGGPAKSVNTI